MNTGMKQSEPYFLEFRGFRLDPAKRLLFQPDGNSVPLMPKAFETLLYLVENGGRVVEKEELFREVWPDTIVEENNLTQNISALRKIFGERPGEHRFIVTVPGSGYKFVADVTRTSGDLRPGGKSEASQVTDTPIRRFWPFALALLAAIFGLGSLVFYFWSGRTQSSAPIRTIAVLPFKPLTAENRDESLELGMAETLIGKLAGAERIATRPLNAVRRFNALDQDPIEAGKRLEVDAVLDGTIQTVAGRVRISAKLFRVSDSKLLWSGQFDEQFTDIFAVQDSISERVASALKISLGQTGRKRYTESVEAYQLYMKGQLHASRLVLPEVQKGISYYEQAISIDPQYALAYVGIANANRALVLTNDAPPIETMTRARTAALKAIEIDDSLPDAHAILGSVAFWFDWDWDAAERHFLKALEVDPNSAVAHSLYAHLLSNTGRHDQAIREARRAVELDPVTPITNALEGQTLYFGGQSDKAIEVLQRNIEMEPNFWASYLFITRVYLSKGMYAETIAAASRARDLSNGNAEASATVAFAYAKAGNASEARRILTDLEQKRSQRYVPSYVLAEIYGALGEKEKALDLLEQSYRDKDLLMVFLGIDPKWNDLRSEPRFVELIKRMNLD